MFSSHWTWQLPLFSAGIVFVLVLATTPPGFDAISGVLLGSPRGPNADSAAYALGASASLALLTLVILATLCATIELILRRRREVLRRRF